MPLADESERIKQTLETEIMNSVMISYTAFMFGKYTKFLILCSSEV
jgi:hypothetical protein